MEEIWKQIEDGYEEYQVSNFGQIKSLKSKNEKILHLDKDRNGYMNVKKYREETGDYWLGYLGPGGDIYDDPSYHEKDQMNNLDFCEQNYRNIWFVVC